MGFPVVPIGKAIFTYLGISVPRDFSQIVMLNLKSLMVTVKLEDGKAFH